MFLRTYEYDDFVDEMWVNNAETPYEQLVIAALGITGEAGEVAELVKKAMRGDGPIDPHKVVKELGDVLFYVTKLAHLIGAHGVDLSYVMEENVRKLADRKERGVMQGTGSER